MAKFIYNFEQILNIKRKLEKQEQMKLAKATKKLSASMQRLEVTKYQYKDSLKDFQEILSSGRIEQVKIKTSNENIAYYHNQAQEQKKIVTHNEKLVNEAKEKLKEALRERKTYEILKDQAYEEYIKEEQAKEAKQIDEIVSFKYKDER